METKKMEATTLLPSAELHNSEASCVSRETARGECSRHRFIVWAAVKRNSCERMTASERLECPLLRCRQRFGTHEEMLRHLADCEQLGTCEYWCYEHMRVERFDDSRCKRCLAGLPSKRRKMICMAKSFFSSLGHKGKKAGGSSSSAGSEFGGDDDEPLLFAPPPPSYDSLGLNHSAGIELLGTEIAEIDSTEVVCLPPPQAAAPAAVDPQALLLPVLPELDSRAGAMMMDHNSMEWQPTPMEHGAADSSMAPSPGGTWRPALQLNTHSLEQFRKMARPRPRPIPVSAPRSKDLSPSSSVRSTTSTMSNISSVFTEASAYSHADTVWSGFATNLTSPVDHPGSPSGILADHALFGVQHTGHFDATCPPSEFLHSLFELPADIPEVKVVPENLSADPALFAFDPVVSANYSYATQVDLTEETNPIDFLEMAPLINTSLPVAPTAQAADLAATAATAFQSDTKAIVGSVRDALNEHVACSLAQVQLMTGNQLAGQLRSLTPQMIATSGLHVLRALLDGHPPTLPIDTICLVHVIYAMSLIVYHESDLSTRCNQLYLQSLAFGGLFSDHDKALYQEVAEAIWYPGNLSMAEINHGLVKPYASLHRTPSQKGKERPIDLHRHIAHQDDPLVCTARTFLDDLECSAILGPSSGSLEALDSDICAKHLQDTAVDRTSLSLPFVAAARCILAQLAHHNPSSPTLPGSLKEVYRRVQSGSTSSVRKFELELLQAGKSCLPSSTYLDEFAPLASRLCDGLYQQYSGGASRRSIYHAHGISLMDRILSNMNSDLHEPPGESFLADDSVLFSDFLNLTNTAGADDSSGALMTFDTLDGPLDLGSLQDPLDDLAIDAEASISRSSSTSTKPTSTGQDLDSSPSSSSRSPASPSSAAAPFDSPSSSAETSVTSSSSPATSSAAKTEAHDCCEICGYKPKGDPQWFKGSMAKHKKLQHSKQPPAIYKCPFPGCTSQYKNRPDNLRQHQIEKNHFVEGEEPTRRPSKRKKMSE